MHDTQTTPQDPYRIMAVTLFELAVKDYIAPMPKDTGHASVETRRKNWLINKTSAEWFLFKDIDYMGRFHIFCTLIRIDPNTARRILLDNKDNLSDIVKKLKENANVPLTNTDK